MLILRKPDEARLTAQFSPADQPAVLVSLGAMRHLLHVWRRMPSASNERHSLAPPRPGLQAQRGQPGFPLVVGRQWPVVLPAGVGQILGHAAHPAAKDCLRAPSRGQGGSRCRRWAARPPAGVDRRARGEAAANSSTGRQRGGGPGGRRRLGRRPFQGLTGSVSTPRRPQRRDKQRIGEKFPRRIIAEIEEDDRLEVAQGFVLEHRVRPVVS